MGCVLDRTNTLSMIRQVFIMDRHGAGIELWDNVNAAFRETEP